MAKTNKKDKNKIKLTRREIRKIQTINDLRKVLKPTKKDYFCTGFLTINKIGKQLIKRYKKDFPHLTEEEVEKRIANRMTKIGLFWSSGIEKRTFIKGKRR